MNSLRSIINGQFVEIRVKEKEEWYPFGLREEDKKTRRQENKKTRKQNMEYKKTRRKIYFDTNYHELSTKAEGLASDSENEVAIFH